MLQQRQEKAELIYLPRQVLEVRLYRITANQEPLSCGLSKGQLYVMWVYSNKAAFFFFLSMCHVGSEVLVLSALGDRELLLLFQSCQLTPNYWGLSRQGPCCSASPRTDGAGEYWEPPRETQKLPHSAVSLTWKHSLGIVAWTSSLPARPCHPAGVSMVGMQAPLLFYLGLFLHPFNPGR